MAVKYDEEELRLELMDFLWDAAGEFTDEFFSVVDREAPVEDGHLHQTFATALSNVGLPQIKGTQSSMQSKGSGDKEAVAAGYGRAFGSKDSVTVTVGTDLGFVERLNSGGTQEADVNGNRGLKAEGAATAGQLYAPRLSDGVRGFLVWMDGGTRRYARSRIITPHGFFDTAEQAVVTLAKEMGFA